MRRCAVSVVSLVLGLAIVSSQAGARSKGQVHPGFQQGQFTIQTITILPPEVMILDDSLTGMEVRYGQSVAAGQMLIRIAESEFRVRGYETVPSQVTPQSLSTEEPLNFAYRELSAQFLRYLDARRKNKRGTERGEHSLGPITALFGERAGADALVFIRAQSIHTAAGRNLLLMAKDEFSYALTVVEAKEGKVVFETPLFFIPEAALEDVGQLASQVRRTLARAFRELPRG